MRVVMAEFMEKEQDELLKELMMPPPLTRHHALLRRISNGW
jgi:hypothetical protein